MASTAGPGEHPGMARRPGGRAGTAPRRPTASRPAREPGQILVLFVLALTVVIVMAGLLVDGGSAYVVRRQAQVGADTAALAAARAAGNGDDPALLAEEVASANGFTPTYEGCDGAQHADGIAVSMPPVSGAFAGQDGYVEVTVRRPMTTSFAGIVGQTCWMISARAVATITTTGVASCSFCSLNTSRDNHTLVLKNSATLRVDGDIYVNSQSGGYTVGTCTPLTRYKVCGDGFDVFGAGGYVSAKTITTVGGWETHDKNIAWADLLIEGCIETPNPPLQLKPANVCIHQPAIADPFNDPKNPGSIIPPPTPGAKPVAGQNGCPIGATVPTGTSAAPALLTITGGTRTLCPGTYYGGLKITGGTITLLGGVYVMVGGGFQALNSTNLDGTAGVLIYSVGGGTASQTTSTANDLVDPPIPGHANLKAPALSSNNNPADPGETVVLTVVLQPEKAGQPLPTGTVDFYDGNSLICAASPVVQKGTTGNIGQATCTHAWSVWGTRAISAVYPGDTIYNPAGDTLTETVRAPTGLKTGPITITTTGYVRLYGPTKGPYAGLTLFQERTSNLTITLNPGPASAPKCAGNVMTQGVPPDRNAPPAACGAIGGLRGTVYAPGQDALVLIEASGMANLQVIAGQIEVDSSANARFGFEAGYFANGSVRLVE